MSGIDDSPLLSMEPVDLNLETLAAFHEASRVSDIADLLNWYPPVRLVDATGRVFYALAQATSSVAIGAKLWALDVVDSENDRVKLANAGDVRFVSDVDATETIESVDEEFTAAAGKYLVLEVTSEGIITLKMVAEWEGFPFPYLHTPVDETLGLYRFDKYFAALWQFFDPTGEELNPAKEVLISESLAGRRLAPDADFVKVEAHEEHPAGYFVPVVRFEAGFGAARNTV